MIPRLEADPELMTQIREHDAWLAKHYPFVAEDPLYGQADRIHDLLEYVDHLIGERDRARDLAVRSGTFQDWKGVDYELNYEPLEPWDDEPTSDRQVQQ